MKTRLLLFIAIAVAALTASAQTVSDAVTLQAPQGVDSIYADNDLDLYNTYAFDEAGQLTQVMTSESVEGAYLAYYTFADGMPKSYNEIFINWWDESVYNGGEPPVTEKQYTFEVTDAGNGKFSLNRVDNDGKSEQVTVFTRDSKGRITNITQKTEVAFTESTDPIKLHYDKSGVALDGAGRRTVVALALLGLHQPRIVTKEKRPKTVKCDGWSYDFIYR